MFRCLHKIKDRKTLVWMYVFTLVPAILLSLYGEFMSYAFGMQFFWSVIMGAIGAGIGFWAFNYAYERNATLKLTLLLSIVFFITGIWIMMHRYYNPYKYMKGVKVTELQKQKKVHFDAISYPII